MKLALFCFVLTGLTWLVHVMWWRIHLPSRQIWTLLLLFVGALPVSAVIGTMVPDLAKMIPASITEWARVVIVYLPLSLAYIATYSAVEQDSPTLRIVKYVANAGPSGRSPHDLSTILNDDVLTGSRLEAMVRDGLVVERGGRYALTARGTLLARLFSMSSALLGIRASG